MKVAVCTICFNEQDIIRACIRNWKGLVDKHLVLVSLKPWTGFASYYDDTYGVAQREGAEVIASVWKSEAEQRSWGLARLYDYDYVLIVDPDELYTKEDQKKLLCMLEQEQVNEVMAENMTTYWKTTDFVFSPPDSHKPIIAVNPKSVTFWDKREITRINTVNISQPDKNKVININIHHLSWVKSDKKVKEKIETYSHQDIIPPDWFDRVWKAWDSESKMEIRPYGIDHSVAIYKPAPAEILELLKQ